jgi:molybdopterin-binding protein
LHRAVLLAFHGTRNEPETTVVAMTGVTMLSARNQLPATVKSVKLGNVMAEVVMTVGDLELVSAITRGSAEQLGLKPGDSVKAVIKATEVLIDKA